VAGDPPVVLDLSAGQRHSQRTWAWRVGRLITALRDKAETTGIGMEMVDEWARPPRAQMFQAGSQAHRGASSDAALRAGRARAPVVAASIAGRGIPAIPEGRRSCTVTPDDTCPVYIRRDVIRDAGPTRGVRKNARNPRRTYEKLR
jgi:hypothetical protein